MQTSRWIAGFSYLPRATGENGIVKTYRFDVSEDNVSWTNVAADVEILTTAADDTQTVRYSETNPPAGAVRRFYRLAYRLAYRQVF
jgi:hypothetical protein